MTEEEITDEWTPAVELRYQERPDPIGAIIGKQTRFLQQKWERECCEWDDTSIPAKEKNWTESKWRDVPTVEEDDG